MKKIGIVGGVGWPSTVDYYRLICSQANAHFKRLGGEPPYPTPPMTIESLVMHETRNLRAKPGESDDAWAAYDAAFRDAFERLQRAGCDIGIIASNTPHTRLASIRRGLRLPIISILDETAQATVALGKRKALVLGTDVTMRSDDYPTALRALGVEPNPTLPDPLIDEMQRLIDEDFYHGVSDAARGRFLDICDAWVDDADDTAVVLACTELALAFPEHGDSDHFQADGFAFVNSTVVHAHAALMAALELPR
jgi:aspartate racemase